jgi:hypothetical protein
MNPPLTPGLGPWLRPNAAKQDQVGWEMGLVGELIDQLPKADVVSHSLSPRLTNWLPFYWRGFSAELRYTYRLEDTSDLDRVWSEFGGNVRGHVRKASKAVEVRSTDDVESFLSALRPTVARAGLPTRLEDVIRRIHHACRERDANTILLAVDASEQVRACSMLVHDDVSAYHLLSGRDDYQPPVGAPSLLVWEGLKHAAARGLAFDFEGSMIESIERFFRDFGARQTPYLRIAKSSIRGRSLLTVRSLLRRHPL